MKRTHIDLQRLLGFDNLTLATLKAARGKRHRPPVQRFLEDLPNSFTQLREEVLESDGPLGVYRRFTLCDPKPRVIHAADFRYRVLHHALMNLAGPVLDRALTDQVFACRKHKGLHKAIAHVQQQSQKYPWVVQIDIDGYFAHIDHNQLKKQLARRIKGHDALNLCARILASYHTVPDKGLPIGSLCSQYWANEYLNGLDRLLQERLKVKGYCRYMDDILWWHQDKSAAEATLEVAQAYLRQHLDLNIKPKPKIQPTQQAIHYCGYRIMRGAILPGQRKRRRFVQQMTTASRRFAQGEINELHYQKQITALIATLNHTDTVQWRAHVLNQMGHWYE